MSREAKSGGEEFKRFRYTHYKTGPIGAVSTYQHNSAGSVLVESELPRFELWCRPFANPKPSGGYRSIVPIIIAAIALPLVGIAGRMMCGFLILNPGSSVGLVAIVALTCTAQFRLG